MFWVGPFLIPSLRTLDSFPETTPSYKVRCVTSFQKLCTITHFPRELWQKYTVSPFRQRQSPYRTTDLIRHAEDFFFKDNPLVIQTPSIFSLTETSRERLCLLIILKARDI